MAFDFPSSPVEGQEYPAPAGPHKYIDGKWALMGGSLAPTPLVGWRNRIINGDFAIDQRNNGGSVPINPGGITYGLDRWHGYNGPGPGAFHLQRVANGDNIGEYGIFVPVSGADASLAAGDIYFFGQGIEGYNVRDLNWGAANAKSVTISFWAMGNIAMTLPLSVRNATGGRTWLGSFPVTTGWTKVVMTIPGDTTGTWEKTNLTGLGIAIALGAGTSYQGVAGWQAGNLLTLAGMTNVMGGSNWFQVRNFQLEVGSVATEFERIEYGEQLARCQRYYWKGLPLSDFNYGSYAVGSYLSWPVMFPVVMRAVPTLLADMTGGTFNGLGVPGFSAPSLMGGRFITASTIISTNCAGTFGSSAYLSASAEL